MKKFSLSAKEKKNLIRILVALPLFVAIFIADKTVGLDGVFGGSYGWLFPFSLYFAVYVVVGYDVVKKAARNIFVVAPSNVEVTSNMANERSTMDFDVGDL